MKGKESRAYPTSCTAMYCPDPTGCETCPCRNIKADFLRWVDLHAAKVLDRVWSPSVYTAQR